MAATPFARIVGQRRATAALGRALSADRLFPSLLFHGPEGTGKLATALALCRALLCPADPPPCGVCRACRRLDERALAHPDVMVILPETRQMFEGGEDPDRAGGIDLQARQADALAHTSRAVLIDRVRRGISFVQRRPSEGRRSILIVDQAHRMEAPAANALLKTLEEPPDHAVLVLTAPGRHALLPTIRSRCQAVPFRLVPQRDIVGWLVEERGLGPEEAVLRAGLSGGRIGAALEIDLDAFRARREALLTLLEDLVRRGDPGIAVARAEALTRGDSGVETDLEILMTLVRDLAVLHAHGGAALPGGAALVNIDIARRLEECAAAFGDRGAAAVGDLESVLAGVRHYGNRQLLVENFLIGLIAPGPQGRSFPAP